MKEFLTAKITSKGQVTIPQKLRERFGLKPNSEVVFGVEHGEVVIKRKPMGRAKMQAWIDQVKGCIQVDEKVLGWVKDSRSEV
jgi:AbrB family looped-hinge helix DNA binding protein